MIKNTSYQPTSPLSKYIDRFYTYEKTSSTEFELSPILPGTGLEIVFHLKQPLFVESSILPDAHSVCPRVISNFNSTKQVNFLSIRFKSGSFRHFTNIPFTKLNNNYLPITKLWPETGQYLLNTLHNLKDIKSKILCLETFLTQEYLKHHKPQYSIWDNIIDDLYYNFKTIKIKDLAKKNNLSLRQFERNFKKQFGLTAKEFQKISRFQYVIKKQLLNKNKDYLSTILDAGYYDQSHFIGEFKSLTKVTPKTFFSNNRFQNHFYHNTIISNKKRSSS